MTVATGKVTKKKYCENKIMLFDELPAQGSESNACFKKGRLVLGV